jgi:EmrB/QacA subfamily drug resistance transporter
MLSIARKPASDRLEPHVKRIAIVIVLGSIMSILDTTIVNIALDTLSKDLHSSFSSIQWVVSAYLLALGAVIPLTGWAVRRFGAFRIYMQALILFTVGSGLCAMANSTAELIFFRALQGIGGGMLMPTGFVLLVRAVGRDNLPKVMSAIGVPMVLAPIFGPTLGGFLLQSVSWHAIFIINVPIGILTAFVAARLLPRGGAEKQSAGRLDWQGLILAAIGIVGVTYGFSQSAAAGSFTSRSVVLPIVVGLVLLVGFVMRASRAKNPLLDMELYKIRAYSAATMVMFCLGAALFGAMILLPLYFQVARGQDAIHTGLYLVPQGIGAAIGMRRSAWATSRFGAGLTSLCGGIVMVAATTPFLFFGAKTSYLLIAAPMVVRGLGIGLAFMPAFTAAFATLNHDQVADASPQLNVIQRVGGSLGTAVIAVILQSKLTHLSTHPSAAATAGAFAATYWWVMALTVVGLIPAVVLWRVERQSRALGFESSVTEQALIEAIA